MIKLILHPKNLVKSWQTIGICSVKPNLSYPHVTTSYSSDQQ